MNLFTRCGALHPGGQILAVGDVRLDGPGGVDVQEVARLLRSNNGGGVVKRIVSNGAESIESIRKHNIPFKNLIPPVVEAFVERHGELPLEWS